MCSPTVSLRSGASEGDPEAEAVLPRRTLAPSRDHFGSGAWIGARREGEPRVVQLYSLAGRHAAIGDWPNAFGGEAWTVQRGSATAEAKQPVQATFERLGPPGNEEHYRIRFAWQETGLSDVFVALAVDPDLGTRAEDDLLGVDTHTGLIWVLDADSAALGYLFSEAPVGARAAVRQFSTWGDVPRPDPVADSAAYRELTSAQTALTERPDDVRFLVSVGPVRLQKDGVSLGLRILRARSLEELRALTSRLGPSALALAPVSTDSTAPTMLTEFRLTQAPPEPTAPPGVARISLSAVPGLAGLARSEATPAPSVEFTTQLRAAVKRHGITALAFAVPDGEPAHVRIRVYDPRGRLMRTLTQETYDPGAYRVQWDLKDEGGARASPGVYVVIMEAPGFRDMTKLVVVR